MCVSSGAHSHVFVYFSSKQAPEQQRFSSGREGSIRLHAALPLLSRRFWGAPRRPRECPRGHMWPCVVVFIVADVTVVGDDQDDDAEWPSPSPFAQGRVFVCTRAMSSV